MPTPRRRRKDLAPLNDVADVTAAIQHLVAAELSHEDIARRAYELYLQRGAVHGLDAHDWFQAELELRQLNARGADVAA